MELMDTVDVLRGPPNQLAHLRSCGPIETKIVVYCMYSHSHTPLHFGICCPSPHFYVINLCIENAIHAAIHPVANRRCGLRSDIYREDTYTIV
jgi:hypothetical protein